MKRIILLTLLLCTTFLSTAAKTLEATLRNPDDFAKLVNALSHADRLEIDRIVLRGPMNTNDCLMLRVLCGYDHTQARTRYRAKFVDLSGVHFVWTFPQLNEFYIHYLMPRNVFDPKVLPDFLFRNCTIEEVILPRSIETIGEGAFEYSDLKKIVIPRNVKRMRSYAFHKCRNLASVTIEGDLEELGFFVFTESDALKRLVFNRVSMMTKGEYACIFGCSALEEILFEGDALFKSVIAESCPALRNVEFKRSVNTEASLKFFVNCPKLIKISAKPAKSEKVLDFRLY